MCLAAEFWLVPRIVLARVLRAECIMPESLAVLALAMQGHKTGLNIANVSSNLPLQHLLRVKHQLLFNINIFQRAECQCYHAS